MGNAGNVAKQNLEQFGGERREIDYRLSENRNKILWKIHLTN